MVVPPSNERSDASRWSHGWFYHTFFDRPLAEARRVVIDLVPHGASVLDIGCGTGELCCGLRAIKTRRVVGVDLSRRMLQYARTHSRFDDIVYEYGDATNLSTISTGEYDYATVLLLLHEIPREQRLKVLDESLRVARHAIVVDSHVPLPRNAHAAALHIVELMGGREHHNSFTDYLATGGIEDLLPQLMPPVLALRRLTFWHGCRDAVVLSRHGAAAAGNEVDRPGSPNSAYS
jgi:SAM-dependent methyltransferase